MILRCEPKFNGEKARKEKIEDRQTENVDIYRRIRKFKIQSWFFVFSVYYFLVYQGTMKGD